MILKYLTHQINQATRFSVSKYSFSSKPPKKRTEAPKHTPQKKQFDPYKANYERVPENLRKGVQATVQAKKMLVTSEGQLEAQALHQVILEERKSLYETVSSYGEIMQKSIEVKGQSKEEQQERKYDIRQALKFLLATNNLITGIGITGFGICFASQNFEALGFFSGAYLHPCMAIMGGMSIGFNCASWIVRTSLHLHYVDERQFTVDKVNLTSCEWMMHLNAVGIALQSFSLGYYLISWQPYSDIEWLIFSLIISQSQLVMNSIKVSLGLKFQYLAQTLWTQTLGVIIMCYLLYFTFGMIKDSSDANKKPLSQEDVESLSEKQESKILRNAQVRMGYEQFLSIFRTQRFEVVEGEKINELLSDD